MHLIHCSRITCNPLKISVYSVAITYTNRERMSNLSKIPNIIYRKEVIYMKDPIIRKTYERSACKNAGTLGFVGCCNGAAD